MTAAPGHDLLAAVDLGSNSFHLLVVRPNGDGFATVEHLFDNVRLAAGVDAHGELSDAHRERALAALRNFATHITDIPAPRIHAVATHAVRELRDTDAFLRPAAAALGQPINVISSNAEARLIWLGVASALAPRSEPRLVIDIGGGSTEFIVGQGQRTYDMRSAAIGCVTTGTRFFADGKLTAERWQRAQRYLRQALQPFARPFREHGWQHVYGTSGSARAIVAALATLRLGNDVITADALGKLSDHLLRLGHVDRFAELQIGTCQQPVFAGGVAVMQAAFDALGITCMHLCLAAMREGMICDLRERVRQSGSAI